VTEIETPAWVRQLFGPEARSGIVESLEQVVERRWRELPHVNSDLPDLAAVHEDVVLRHGERHLVADVYVPHGDGPFPLFLYMHGGGWCHGSSRSVRRLAMRFAAEGLVVVNLDYALAPEHRFPRQVEDAVYAARWAVANAERFGGDGSALAIGGDSAGANLAAAAIAYLAGGVDVELDEGDLAGVPVTFSAAVLFYGIFDFPLLIVEPVGPTASVEMMFNYAYLGPTFLSLHRHPLVSPAFAPRLSAFPPTYLSCGDRDLLLPQSLAMTKALSRSGVPTTLSVVAGADHTFAQLEHELPSATPELERIFAWLSTRVHGAANGT
jgi:acetyl esterase